MVCLLLVFIAGGCWLVLLVVVDVDWSMLLLLVVLCVAMCCCCGCLLALRLVCCLLLRLPRMGGACGFLAVLLFDVGVGERCFVSLVLLLLLLVVCGCWRWWCRYVLFDAWWLLR